MADRILYGEAWLICIDFIFIFSGVINKISFGKINVIILEGWRNKSHIYG
jgi:hypothetical protein